MLGAAMRRANHDTKDLRLLKTISESASGD